MLQTFAAHTATTRAIVRHRNVFQPDKSCANDNGGELCVLSKLKCPAFLAHDMSGFIVNQQQSGLWESGNRAQFAGFPSEVGKSGFVCEHDVQSSASCRLLGLNTAMLKCANNLVVEVHSICDEDNLVVIPFI